MRMIIRNTVAALIGCLVITTAHAADTTTIQSELAKAKTDLESLRKANQSLTADLAAARANAVKAQQLASRLNDLERENKRLTAALADAKAQGDTAQKAATATSDALTKQNKELSDKLAGTAGRAAEAESLRKQLASVQTELTTAKQAAAQVGALTKQNQQLNTELAAQKEQVASLSQTRAELAEKNKLLNSQLDENQKTPFVRPQSVGESSEVAQLKAQLEEAKANNLRLENATTRIEELTKQNESLQQRLDAARRATTN